MQAAAEAAVAKDRAAPVAAVLVAVLVVTYETVMAILLVVL